MEQKGGERKGTQHVLVSDCPRAGVPVDASDGRLCCRWRSSPDYDPRRRESV